MVALVMVGCEIRVESRDVPCAPAMVDRVDGAGGVTDVLDAWALLLSVIMVGGDGLSGKSFDGTSIKVKGEVKVTTSVETEVIIVVDSETGTGRTVTMKVECCEETSLPPALVTVDIVSNLEVAVVYVTNVSSRVVNSSFELTVERTGETKRVSVIYTVSVIVLVEGRISGDAQVWGEIVVVMVTTWSLVLVSVDTQSLGRTVVVTVTASSFASLQLDTLSVSWSPYSKNLTWLIYQMEQIAQFQ